MEIVKGVIWTKEKGVIVNPTIEDLKLTLHNEYGIATITYDDKDELEEELYFLDGVNYAFDEWFDKVRVLKKLKKEPIMDITDALSTWYLMGYTADSYYDENENYNIDFIANNKVVGSIKTVKDVIKWDYPRELLQFKSDLLQY